MLDFDFVSGRKTPSVACVVSPGATGGFLKLFFGQHEVSIMIYGTIEEAARKHPKADVFINYASYRSATESSLEALKQPTIRTVAIIAEGVPERDTKHLIAYARANNKVIIGPATVGGVQAGAFKIGDTAGTLDNIVACKLHRYALHHLLPFLVFLYLLGILLGILTPSWYCPSWYSEREPSQAWIGWFCQQERWHVQ
jgi:ATP citrate (pro-S)-lyase